MAAASAARAAAAETARRLEREKALIQAEAKKREEELLNTIRQQQQELQRLQQAAALAEQKAKVGKPLHFGPLKKLQVDANTPCPSPKWLKCVVKEEKRGSEYKLFVWEPKQLLNAITNKRGEGKNEGVTAKDGPKLRIRV